MPQFAPTKVLKLTAYKKRSKLKLTLPSLPISPLCLIDLRPFMYQALEAVDLSPLLFPDCSLKRRFFLLLYSPHFSSLEAFTLLMLASQISGPVFMFSTS